MGSGDWLKSIICIKKPKVDNLKQLKGSSAPEKSNGKWRNHSRKESINGRFKGDPRTLGMPIEDVAAIRIQTAFRAYKARKSLRQMKGIVRFRALTREDTVRKQSATTLNYIQSWNKIQGQIRARRYHMVVEDRIRQKKLDNQVKLEAKLHDLEVEWCGGSETMEEIIARIQQREDAAVKRERAMAYAFSHQWRANSTQYLGRLICDVGKDNWGWSWKERWVAARPWEVRVPVHSNSPKKAQSRPESKTGQNTPSPAKKQSISTKPTPPNAKVATKMKGPSSKPASEKSAPQKENAKAEDSSPSKTEETNS
ncbi:hypothetical protein Sjap_000439 [Stephania japonica]|uniref:Uncharacterized protein n=1 Tax=Stephania japonica TaxID=461633 RepID=A0AAP0KJV3_9MAGN